MYNVVFSPDSRDSILYEVNIEILKTLSSSYEAWLEGHVEEVLKTGSFLNAQIYKRESSEPNYAGYTLHYKAKNETLLQTYLKDYAPRLRQDAEARFGGNFTASRRILRPLNNTNEKY